MTTLYFHKEEATDKEFVFSMKQRMRNHTIVNDVALVVLTASELEHLINLAEKNINDHP